MKKLKLNIKQIIPFIGLIIVFLLFSLTTRGKFLDINNLQIILTQSIIVMIAGIGVTFVMAHGNLEFSIGGELAICSIVAYFASMVSVWLALPAAILTGILCSQVSAWINNIMKVPAFMVGMCVMFLGRGLAQGMSLDFQMNTPKALLKLDSTGLYLTVLVVVYVIGYIILEHTKVGSYNKAIGENENAALYSGVSINVYKAIAFAISGATIGICAVLTLIRTAGVGATTGQSLETNTLIAVVLGGMSLTGGTSIKLRSVIIGALTFFMLSNGLSLWGVNPDIINIIKAGVFLVCVFLSYDRESGVIPI